jgi:uncharacterized repeat protein (TIGR01451 family)
VHAQVVGVEQILCFVDKTGDALDGQTGTFPVFNLQECSDAGGVVTDWCPNIPGNQAQDQLPCIPPDTDVCPNIDGTQAAVPDGKVLENGQCVDAANNGGGGGDSSSDLSIQKTVSNASPAPSSTIVYTIAVHNAGPDAAQNVSVTDALPSGAAYVSDDGSGAYDHATGVWTIGALGSDATATLAITVTDEAAAGVEVTNTASIAHSDSNDPNGGNNAASVSFTSAAATQGGGETGSSGGNSSSGGSSGGGGHHRSSGGSSNDANQGEVLGAETQECPMYLTGYIKYGANNDAGEVAKLQVFLNMYEGNALAVSGTYDRATLAAVNAFQRKYASDVLEPWGLKGVTGYVYYTTRKEINTIFCKFQRDFPLSAAQLDEISYVRAIQPQLRAQGITSMGTTHTTAARASARAAKPATTSSVGSVVPQSSQPDENATRANTAPQKAATAAAATTSTTAASSTPGWFGKFVNWLFGR